MIDAPAPTKQTPAAGYPMSNSSIPPRTDDTPRRRSIQDHPWETAVGVPPVVLPPNASNDFDPGPAIGLSE
ncbi:hypothetical protein [Asanoa sp. NPDC050611]|uniref:hypothetical protein n=1 Tax=Asanoa sp. NPDC050611 TaxID=3157098 RepID=UPI0033C855A0